MAGVSKTGGSQVYGKDEDLRGTFFTQEFVDVRNLLAELQS